MKKIVSVLTEAASDIERGIDFYEAIEEINDSKNILIISVSCNFCGNTYGFIARYLPVCLAESIRQNDFLHLG